MELQLSKVTASAYDGDGVPEVQLELFGAEESSCVPAECYSPYGFRGRARDPEKDSEGRATNGTRALQMREGNTLHAIPLDDPRDTHVPQLKPGGSAQYCAVSGAHGVFDGENGAYELRVPAGQKVVIQVGSGAKVEITDTTVKIGDDLARSLAHSLEVGLALTALQALATGLSTYADSIKSIADPVPPNAATTALIALCTAASTAITAGASTLPTTKALGT